MKEVKSIGTKVAVSLIVIRESIIHEDINRRGRGGEAERGWPSLLNRF
jgi:hypothetical protein